MKIEEAKKRCKGKCRELKPLSEFHRQSKSKDGRRPKCGACTSKARGSQKKVVEPVEAKNAPIQSKRIKDDCMKAWWV